MPYSIANMAAQNDAYRTGEKSGIGSPLWAMMFPISGIEPTMPDQLVIMQAHERIRTYRFPPDDCSLRNQGEVTVDGYTFRWEIVYVDPRYRGDDAHKVPTITHTLRTLRFYIPRAPG